MTREDIQKLLGGYATGTLTPEEQQVLFEAALDDQELFDALAREQSLRDLLRDPAAKAQLLAALDEKPSRWHQILAWWRPAAAVVAMTGLASVVVVALRHGPAAKPVIMAQMTPPPPAPPSASPVDRLTIDGKPLAPKPSNRPQDSDKQKVEARLDALSALSEESRKEAAASPAALSKKAEPLQNEVTVASTSPPAAAPPAPVFMASGLRDAARGGSGGGGGASGAVGGVVGGVPGAVPLASPFAPAPVAKKEVQVSAQSVELKPAALETLAMANAQVLFYSAPALPQRSLESDSKTTAIGRLASPRSFRQQQGQQGQQGQQSPQAQQQQQQQQQPSEPQQQAAPVVGPPLKPVAAKSAPSVAVTYPGIRYRILRKTSAGDFAPADPESLKSGDAIKLEFMANDNGLLSVTSGGRGIISRQVERLTPYTTELLPASDRDLAVLFSRPAGVAAITGAAKLVEAKDSGAATPLRRSTADGAVYVVAAPAAPQVSFTITLNYK